MELSSFSFDSMPDSGVNSNEIILNKTQQSKKKLKASKRYCNVSCPSPTPFGNPSVTLSIYVYVQETKRFDQKS